MGSLFPLGSALLKVGHRVEGESDLKIQQNPLPGGSACLLPGRAGNYAFSLSRSLGMTAAFPCVLFPFISPPRIVYKK